MFLCRNGHKLGCLPSEWNCFGLKKFLPEQCLHSAIIACGSDSCLGGPRGKHISEGQHQLTENLNRAVKIGNSAFMLPADEIIQYQCNTYHNSWEKWNETDIHRFRCNLNLPVKLASERKTFSLSSATEWQSYPVGWLALRIKCKNRLLVSNWQENEQWSE